MNVIGREIGDALDELRAEIERRLRVEAERELGVEAADQQAISSLRWSENAVLVLLHQDIPTHALPHVFAIALQHVRQRLDRYPDVRRPDGEQPDEAPLLRQALRELVLAPEAEMQIESLALDLEWEVEQRHAALKEMLREPPEAWQEPGDHGHSFITLQYARFALQHPPEMWEGLRKSFSEKLPAASEGGEQLVDVIRASGWGTPGACLQSLVGARDELKLQDVALIQDRRSGELL